MKLISKYVEWVLTGLLFVLISGISLLHAEGFSPTVVLGAYGTGIVFSEGGSEADTTGSIGFCGVLGWRKPFTSGGYLAVNSSFDLTGYLVGIQEIYDEEMGYLELSLPSGGNRLKIGAGFSSSISGTGSLPTYFRPDWKAEYHFNRGRRKVQPFIAYLGYLLIQPDYNEDVFFQGGEAGFSFQPSIRYGYEVSFRGGWESWYEFPLYDEDGCTLEQKRQDYIISLSGNADGLIGYFIDWYIDGKVALRFSNANRYLEVPSKLDENSETRISVILEGGMGWSPTRHLNIQIGPYTARDFYIDREAVDDDGSLMGENLNVLTIGSSFRVDWTADDRFYVVVRGSGARKYANDVAESGWNALLSGGVEYSF